MFFGGLLSFKVEEVLSLAPRLDLIGEGRDIPFFRESRSVHKLFHYYYTAGASLLFFSSRMEKT